MIWIPFPNFRMSARVLSAGMLGRQYYACLDVLESHHLGDERRGRRASQGYVLMWKDWPGATIRMMWSLRQEILLRGYEFALPDPLSEAGRKLYIISDGMLGRIDEIPPWLGGESLHSSHRGRLLREDPEWFLQFGWSELPSSVIEWPALLPKVGDAVARLDTMEVRRVYEIVGRDYTLLAMGGGLTTVDVSEFSPSGWRRCTEI